MEGTWRLGTKRLRWNSHLQKARSSVVYVKKWFYGAVVCLFTVWSVMAVNILVPLKLLYNYCYL